MNQTIERVKKENWKMTNEMRRLSTRNLLEKKSQWRWNEEHDKMIRKEDKENIDWWRYQNVILLSKLISFAEQCNQRRKEADLFNMIVQENKVSAHVSKHQISIFSRHNIERFLWSSNSSDLNMIESAWPWMKRRTTCKEAFTSRLTAKSVWERSWADLSQSKIQEWIERISRHIVKVIELNERNEYCENRLDVDRRTKEEKQLLAKLKANMLNQCSRSASVRSVSSSISSSSSSRQFSSSLSSFNFTRYYVASKSSTSKSLISSSSSAVLKKVVISSPHRVQKVVRTAASFRSKRDRKWSKTERKSDR